MNLDDILGPNPNVIELFGDNRWQAIDELINHLETTQKIRDNFRDGLRRRFL